jgi:hypothetical protein
MSEVWVSVYNEVEVGLEVGMWDVDLNEDEDEIKFWRN